MTIHESLMKAIQDDRWRAGERNRLLREARRARVGWGGALTATLTGVGLRRLGDRIPGPLLQAQCPPPPAVSAASGPSMSAPSSSGQRTVAGCAAPRPADQPIQA